MGEHQHTKLRGGAMQTADERRLTAEPQRPRLSKREMERRVYGMVLRRLYAGIDDVIDMPTMEEMEAQHEI